ncbi:MAG: hypothetical protein PVH00_10615 [Gemmatimonadota bacterium]|jgi:hypothetical protein
MMFVLDKWYFDAIGADGTTFIGYTASLRWLGLSVGYDAFLLSPPDAPARERASIGTSHSPVRQPDDVAWSSPGLGVAGTWQRTAPRVRRRLHKDGRGSVLWLCEQPRARARVEVGDTAVEGTGYVERLRMTLPPTDLPVDTLHWGRFHARSETLVWVTWQYGTGGSWIFRNGRRQTRAGLLEQGIFGLDGGASLEFNGRRELRDRRVLPALAAVPGFRHRAAGKLAGMHETKWVGRGVLRGANGEPDGWLIHEEVTWGAHRD